jgi:oligoendopeptidase F
MVRLLAAVACALLCAGSLAAEEGRADLTQIYPDWAAWEKDFGRLETAVASFSALQKEAMEGPPALLRALESREAVHQLASKVEGYVRLRLLLDATDSEAQAREQRAGSLTARW